MSRTGRTLALLAVLALTTLASAVDSFDRAALASLRKSLRLVTPVQAESARIAADPGARPAPPTLTVDGYPPRKTPKRINATLAGVPDGVTVAALVLPRGGRPGAVAYAEPVVAAGAASPGAFTWSVPADDFDLGAGSYPVAAGYLDAAGVLRVGYATLELAP